MPQTLKEATPRRRRRPDQTSRRDFDGRRSAARVAFQIWQPELFRQLALASQRIRRGDQSSIGRSAASLNRNKDSRPIETGLP